MNDQAKNTAKDEPRDQSWMSRVGPLGLLKLGFGLFVFLLMTLFYTIIPIAGLGLLPFLYFGCICLMVGICDDIGLYR